MTTAREIMHPRVQCVDSTATAQDAARIMNEQHVGSLPVCGKDDRLEGVVTDRDIVTKVIARGHDPATVHAGEPAQGEAVTIGADDDTGDLLATMCHHRVRRIPVIDGHRLVGIIAQADVARTLSEPTVGDLITALSYD
ncbi:CBS domain-containing protein [Tsukamurella sp. 8F]|uniref:CBS domain-containing protein n=1 Tax=unclassified Tsukamurella TaxID=2633480 RepID=UPI0023B8F297|nr:MULTISPECIES: CBS domain-containing protein [unclassified Tsukamurella]MDF0532350.1 CBS domain-containing protein [Tsukamurella sp. 8J]MDF0588818.1 CBS domain-containing protein [Tsukamurella sp. 8F]